MANDVSVVAVFVDTWCNNEYVFSCNICRWDRFLRAISIPASSSDLNTLEYCSREEENELSLECWEANRICSSWNNNLVLAEEDVASVVVVVDDVDVEVPPSLLLVSLL